MSDTRNPKETPPDPLPVGVPWNVLTQLQGIAAAYVKTAETKQAYDNIVPKSYPATVAQAPLRPAPMGPPISAGRRIEPDAAKYVIDKDIRRRID